VEIKYGASFFRLEWFLKVKASIKLIMPMEVVSHPVR
jgi:hypothetical protein